MSQASIVFHREFASHDLIFYENSLGYQKSATIQGSISYARKFFFYKNVSTITKVAAGEHFCWLRPLRKSIRGDHVALVILAASKCRSESSSTSQKTASLSLRSNKGQTLTPIEGKGPQRVATISHHDQAHQQYSSRWTAKRAIAPLGWIPIAYLILICSFIGALWISFAMTILEEDDQDWPKNGNTSTREQPYYQGSYGPFA